MEFALQVLFQTFFLEVSRAGISVRTRRTFCGRLYTKNSVPPKEMVLVYCAGATVVQCWRSAAIGKVHVTGTVRVHVTGMVRMHTGNTATHPRQCGTNGTPVRAKGSTPPICTNICTNATPVRRQNNAEAGSAVTCAAMVAV